MRKELGLLVVECDAPPYGVVQACAELGFHTPEDVRWLRCCHSSDQPTGFWNLLSGKASHGKLVCSCGRDLPQLEQYLFVTIGGEELVYLLGQCVRCGTMYWEPTE